MTLKQYFFALLCLFCTSGFTLRAQVVAGKSCAGMWKVTTITTQALDKNSQKPARTHTAHFSDTQVEETYTIPFPVMSEMRIWGDSIQVFALQKEVYQGVIEYNGEVLHFNLHLLDDTQNKTPWNLLVVVKQIDDNLLVLEHAFTTTSRTSNEILVTQQYRFQRNDSVWNFLTR